MRTEIDVEDELILFTANEGCQLAIDELSGRDGSRAAARGGFVLGRRTDVVEARQVGFGPRGVRDAFVGVARPSTCTQIIETSASREHRHSPERVA